MFSPKHSYGSHKKKEKKKREASIKQLKNIYYFIVLIYLP